VCVWQVHEVATASMGLLLIALTGLLTRGIGLEGQLYRACEWSPPVPPPHCLLAVLAMLAGAPLSPLAPPAPPHPFPPPLSLLSHLSCRPR
jgi:hypothetical protein